MEQTEQGVPITCQTCRHMATHKACGNPGGPGYCLGDIRKDERNQYRNWEHGNWARDRLEAEQAGTRNIVIGGTGEAECDTQTSLADTLKHLHYVAEQCGYSVHKRRNAPEIEVWNEGLYVLVFENDRLARIDSEKESGERSEWWPCEADAASLDVLFAGVTS